MQKQPLPLEQVTSGEQRWASKLAQEAALWRSKKRPGRMQRISANGREILAERILRLDPLKAEPI
jgi:hypothetical protein